MYQTFTSAVFPIKITIRLIAPPMKIEQEVERKKLVRHLNASIRMGIQDTERLEHQGVREKIFQCLEMIETLSQQENANFLELMAWVRIIRIGIKMRGRQNSFGENYLKVHKDHIHRRAAEKLSSRHRFHIKKQVFQAKKAADECINNPKIRAKIIKVLEKLEDLASLEHLSASDLARINQLTSSVLHHISLGDMVALGKDIISLKGLTKEHSH